MVQPTEVAIIGSGAAGYTAAVYAARAGLRPVVFTGAPTEEAPQRLAGGQLMITTDIENFPGFPEGIAGPELMERMARQAERAGAELRAENVVRVDLAARPYRILGEETEVVAASLIVATGAQARWLGVPGESAYRGRGVATCAACDGALFAGQEVLVVGGGETAIEEAVYLSRLAGRVRLLHRGERLRASAASVERILAAPGVEVIYRTVLEEVLGNDDGMTGARVRDTGSAETRELAATGLFVAIGHTPATALFRGPEATLALDEHGYLRTEPGSTRTSVPGVFAAGDVQDPVFRQAITAAGSGAMAAIEAQRFLERSLERTLDPRTRRPS